MRKEEGKEGRKGGNKQTNYIAPKSTHESRRITVPLLSWSLYGARTAQKYNAFANTIGWRKHYNS